MTWKPTPVPDEEAFAAIKAGIDALPPGVKMFLNSGGFHLIWPGHPTYTCDFQLNFTDKA
jgi:pyridoxine 4-dehydrogenase